MGFKMGTNRGLEATNGEIKTKMRFGKQSGGEGSVPGTPVIRVPLENGDNFEILGEANMDGSIYISDKLEPGSFEDRQTINHEMRHATDIRIGKLEYADTVSNAQENIELSKENPIAKKSTLPGINTEIDKK